MENFNEICNGENKLIVFNPTDNVSYVSPNLVKAKLSKNETKVTLTYMDKNAEHQITDVATIYGNYGEHNGKYYFGDASDFIHFCNKHIDRYLNPFKAMHSLIFSLMENRMVNDGSRANSEQLAMIVSHIISSYVENGASTNNNKACSCD